MPNRFAEMKSRLADRIIARGSETVAITHDENSANVSAVVAPIVVEFESTNGQLVRAEMTSFICPRDELVFNETLLAEPVAGMRITRTIDEETETYQVESPGQPRKCFEWIADKKLVRLFAVRIE